MRLFIVYLLILSLTSFAFGKKKGSPPMSAGAPGDRSCATSKCHAGSDINSGDAKIFITGVPQKFVPNEIYDISLHLSQRGAKKWGFEVTVADSLGNASGHLISLEGQPTQILNNARYRSRTNRQYITHTEDGISGSEKGTSPIWSFQWQAPDSGSGVSTFYFGINAANGNNKKTGDHIYMRTLETSEMSD